MQTHGIYLLDTDTCVALLKEKPNVVNRLREVGASNCKISDITLAELYFGNEQHFSRIPGLKIENWMEPCAKTIE